MFILRQNKIWQNNKKYFQAKKHRENFDQKNRITGSEKKHYPHLLEVTPHCKLLEHLALFSLFTRLGEKSKSKLRFTHLDFNRKLNSRPDLFSSIFFYLSTPSAAKMQFYFLHFLQGINAQNETKSNLAKIGPKSDNFIK